MSKRGAKNVHDILTATQGVGALDKNLVEAIAQSLPAALFCKDYTSGIGKFILWNKAAEKLWGLRSAQVVGRSDYDLFPSAQADYFKEKDLQVLQQNQPLYIESENVDSPTFGKRTVRTWKVPVKLGTEGIPFLLGISWDITRPIDFQKKTSKS